ncbi:hypothetical protein TWF696_007920 [Orbilia brochopaga]|uniref:Uncharacterized protein n=1 Tax=Orbilia brochopaga TaxID=3140254 RepID=A0AAV9UQB0_9PEZI
MAALLFHYRNFDRYRTGISEMWEKAHILEDEAMYLVNAMQDFLTVDVPFDAPSALPNASIVRAKIRTKSQSDVDEILAERDYLMNLWSYTVKPHYATFATEFNDLFGAFNNIYNDIMMRINIAFRNTNVLDTDLVQCKGILDDIRKDMVKLQDEHQLLIDVFQLIRDEMWLVYNFSRMVRVAEDGTKTIGWDFEFSMPEFKKDGDVQQEEVVAPDAAPKTPEAMATTIDAHDEDDNMSIDDDGADHDIPGCSSFQLENYNLTEARPVSKMRVSVYQTRPVTTIHHSPTSSKIKTRSHLAKRKVIEKKDNKKKATKKKPIEKKLNDAKVTKIKKETKKQESTRRSTRLKIKDEEADNILKYIDQKVQEEATQILLSECNRTKGNAKTARADDLLGAAAIFPPLNRDDPSVDVTPPAPAKNAIAPFAKSFPPPLIDDDMPEIEGIPPPPPISASYQRPTGEQVVEIKLLLRPRLGLDLSIKKATKEPVLVQESIPVEESVPLEEPIPIDPSILVEESIPAKESISVEGSLPVQGFFPIQDFIPIEGSLPVEESISVEEPISVCDESTVLGTESSIQADRTEDLCPQADAIKPVSPLTPESDDDTIDEMIASPESVVSAASTSDSMADIIMRAEQKTDEHRMRKHLGGLVWDMIREFEATKPQHMRKENAKPVQIEDDGDVEMTDATEDAIKEIPVESLEGYEEVQSMQIFEMIQQFDDMMTPIPHSISKSAFEDPATGTELPTTKMTAVQATILQVAQFFRTRDTSFQEGFEKSPEDEEDSDEEDSDEEGAGVEDGDARSCEMEAE